MMTFLINIQWQDFAMPIVALYFVSIAPMNLKFKQLKGHFPRGDAALKKALLIKTGLPILALGVAFLGLIIATQISNLILAWVVGLTGLIASAGLFALFYVGLLYPLFDEISDAETRANRFVDCNSAQKGT